MEEFFSGVNYSRVIVVVCDSDGSVITSLSQLISQAYTSDEIEAMLSYCGSLLEHRFFINYVTLMLREKVIGLLTVWPDMLRISYT